MAKRSTAQVLAAKRYKLAQGKAQDGAILFFEAGDYWDCYGTHAYKMRGIMGGQCSLRWDGVEELLTFAWPKAEQAALQAKLDELGQRAIFVAYGEYVAE